MPCALTTQAAMTTPSTSLRRPSLSTSTRAIPAPFGTKQQQPRQCRRRRCSGVAVAVASLVGFPRPSPPWSSSIRASLASSSSSSPSSVGRIGEEARTTSTSTKNPPPPPLFESLHHVGLLVSDLERSLEFYRGVLGLELNPDRPDDKLPYRGAWLWIGASPSPPRSKASPPPPSNNNSSSSGFTGQMIHLMELPSPDPTEGRPAHGGRDRHFCVGVRSVAAVVERLQAAGVAYTSSASGRAAAFFRDPDGNVLECAEM